jgi:prolyl-tRNA editing enzyme YbaK/EbsC (Cys-tRNA(Pro) deacylase)|tara:strand:- start:63 stop:548 length:486 start_codon:yes stop_codon:yes gene_type:complete
MNELINRKAVTKVKNYLNKFDENIELIVLDETARTAIDAANSLKTEVGSIVKSLLFKDNDNNYYLCLVSGDKYVSTDKISQLVGLTIKKTTAQECKEFTGYSIGGVSPIAHDNKPKLILIDKNLSKYEKVFAAAGHPYVVFGVTYLELVKLTNGTVNNIVE